MEHKQIAGAEWTLDNVSYVYDQIETIATEELKLDVYHNQIEVITSEQMIDAYSSIGMPVMYKHWSYGKQYVRDLHNYQTGKMGLAYEIVINSNPCIAYLMEDNTMMMQSLVIAHACFGHNAFFKNNYLFRRWTDADNHIDFLMYAKNFVQECEDKYGEEEVMLTLDACHALQNMAVDRYKRPEALTAEELEQRRVRREKEVQTQVNELWSTIPGRTADGAVKGSDERVKFPSEPQENILRFIAENSPFAQDWQRELMMINCKIAQYFYPQKQTQVSNEGFATFTHYTIMRRLYEKGIIGQDFWLEFLESHTGVINQPTYGQFNPYALGFNIYKEIKRVSVEPTEEDREWFAGQDWVGRGDWVDQINNAMRNYRDESFIRQFLTPKLIRDFGMFSLLDEEGSDELLVTEIQDKEGYENIREILADRYTLANLEPNIQVVDVDLYDTRTLTLRHFINSKGQTLDQGSARSTLNYVKYLWGFQVMLEEVNVFNNGMGEGVHRVMGSD